MAWASFLFALHTTTELFLVGVERLPLLEQVKPRNWQIVIAEVGNGLGDGVLRLAAGGLLLTARRLSILCRAGLRLIVRIGIAGCRLYLWNNNRCCSIVRLGLPIALIAALQLLHSICFSNGHHPVCLAKSAHGNILPHTLHLFQ